MIPRFADGPRVLLRALERSDAQALSNLRDHVEVARYQSWNRFTPRDAQALIEQMLPRQPDSPGQWYQFGIVLRDSGKLIGDCGLRRPGAEPTQAEIGFTLGQAYWGRGYATEAVSALITWLFETRRKQRIFAVTDSRNNSSRRLLEKLGFRRDRRFDRIVWFKGEFGPESVWVVERTSPDHS
jgi:RimJ/RimL family protein N-acetyltransferase